MAWDNARPVPWERLAKEWVIYALVMGAVFLLLFRDGNYVGAMAGVLVSGPLYLMFGVILAKFGYQRKTLKELRTPQADSGKESAADSGDTATRHKPPPTSRTATGPNRPHSKKRR